MNTFLKTFFGLLLLFSASAQAMNIVPSHSGSWYNQDQSGHGLSVEVVNSETLLVYWHTYQPDGESLWLMSVANIDGDTATGDAYYLTGMQFGVFDPAPLNSEIWGELSLTFLGCNSARLSYDSPMEHDGVAYGAGEIDLVRLTFIDGLNCQALKQGQFGNYSSGLVIGRNYIGWPDTSFVWISRDGTLAYHVANDGIWTEIAYGQLTMTGENTFEFDVTTSDGVRQGTGLFEDARVTLDLDELGILSEPLDPSFNDPITLDEIAGDYSGPDGIFTASVDVTGEFTGISIGGEIAGTLTIPEPGFNQLVEELRFDTGINEGLGVYHRATGHLLFISRRGDEVWSETWYGDQDFMPGSSTHIGKQ